MHTYRCDIAILAMNKNGRLAFISPAKKNLDHIFFSTLRPDHNMLLKKYFRALAW